MIKKIIKNILGEKLSNKLYLMANGIKKYNLLDSLKPMSLIYNINDLNKKYYDKIKNTGNREFEHQIGRLINFKKIISKCSGLKGEFIEFGSWRGFSLLWIAYFMERFAIINKKLIGIDGFIGLPYEDKLFFKGQFNNTSLRLCKKNVLNSNILYPETIKQIHIKKYLYRQKQEILKYLMTINVKGFCFIHIDCDVSQSAIEIFDILIDGDLIADKAYILFDDYGCDSGLRRVVDKFLKKISDDWIIKVDSNTKFTKNYLLIKK
ncbi:MAG: TylF/MycF/NovP-related O-methyltransferase [Microgenomates group bacterium]